MEPPIISTPQKRKASVSRASGPTKRTRSISISIKVIHGAVPDDTPGDPGLAVVPKNPQACFSGMPEELLLNIFENLYQDYKVLAKLCRADKRCKRIAEALLYKDMCCSSCDYSKAQAVASNPLLAKHICTVVGETSQIPASCDRDSVQADTAKETYIKIVANAHNVRKLVLWENVAFTLGWRGLFNSTVTQPVVDGYVNRFAYLNNLTIRANVLSLEEISCIFSLPSLEVLSLQDIQQTTPFKHWSVPASSSPIREIALGNAMIDIHAVVQMISSVKALRCFVYDHNTTAWEPFGDENSPLSIWPDHSWKLLGDALRKHRDSLEELHSFNHCEQAILDLVYPHGQDAGTLGSFQDFPKLEFCGVPMEAFLDPTMGDTDLSLYLPRHLRRWYTHITPETPRLLETCASALASLHDVVCVGQDRTVRVLLSDELPFQTLDLSSALAILEEAGIRVELRYDYNTITLDDLRHLESSDDEIESDADQEDTTDEAEDEELVDVEDEGESGVQNDHSLDIAATEEEQAVGQPKNEVEESDVRSSVPQN